jgi:hypothetical protein
MKTNKRRQVTETQIRLLKAWIPFGELARALGMSRSHANKLRNGHFQHKTPSP